MTQRLAGLANHHLRLYRDMGMVDQMTAPWIGLLSR